MPGELGAGQAFAGGFEAAAVKRPANCRANFSRREHLYFSLLARRKAGFGRRRAGESAFIANLIRRLRVANLAPPYEDPTMTPIFHLLLLSDHGAFLGTSIAGTIMIMGRVTRRTVRDCGVVR